MVVRQLRRNRGAIVGLIMIVFLALMAVAAPWVAPYDPLQQSIQDALQSPSAQHLFGTDELGRDMLSRIIYGARISLRVGLISVAIGSTIGTTMGIISGFYGRAIDNLLMRITDVLAAFPGMLLALTVIAVLGPGLFNAMIAVGVGSIPSYSRIARGSTMAIRSCLYVESARSVGCQGRRIMWRYILPNVLPPLIVIVTLGVAGAILTASGLSFLGLGAKPPTPEWGAMLSSGRQYLRTSPWVAIFPGLAITITVVSINLFGDGLRDALDPRLRR
jgi:ABC-type dipeptide/oligopeptide/nickel transport system permease subunit